MTMTRLNQRYRLLDEVGRGGMSIVWQAHDEVLDRPVAVKVLDPAYADDDAFRDRIRREARASARLSHPHVGAVHDFGQATDGLPYMVMELIDGRSLADRLGDGPLPAAEAFAICAEVAAALAETHARGLVHRDVKPGNVMLSAGGAKLVDFGISTVLGEAGAPDVREPSTDPGNIVFGTPAYVAPELLTGHCAGTAADVYSLGVVLHQALTGRLPWSVDTATQLLRSHVLRAPLPLPAVDGVPADVISLSERCLCKDPAQRPTCAQLAAAWSAAAGTAGSTVSAGSDVRSPAPTAVLLRRHPVAAARRAVRRHRWAVALAALAAALAGFGAIARSHPAGRPVAQPGTPTASPTTAAPACTVVYRLNTDDGHGFSGILTVQNTGPQPIQAGTVSFTYPGSQQVTGTSLAQVGDTVTVHTDALPPGATGRFAFTGRYDGVNAMPDRFTLDQTACTAQAVGVTGQPVQMSVPDPEPKTAKQAANPKPAGPKATKPGKKP